jgi:hypothetical protein
MKSAAQNTFKRGNADEWTRERLLALSAKDIKQLRENAQRLNEEGLVALCSEVLKLQPRGAVKAQGKGSPLTRARKLIPRTRAFEAQGIFLQDQRTSWGGVRKSDGGVVMALWAEAIESRDGACSYLLWAPNVEGSRPWSDMAGGLERLAHCKRALERGSAQGLLVYGRRLQGRIPEDKASAVHGVDAETLIAFEVQQRGAEFWAVWGKASAGSSS